jgi:hypothetical protein
MRKAAKAWHLRFELIKMLHAVDKFVLSAKTAVKVSSKVDTYASQGEEQEAAAQADAKNNTEDANNDWVITEDEAELPNDMVKMRLYFLSDIIKQELAFCARVNKYHPRNYY